MPNSSNHRATISNAPGKPAIAAGRVDGDPPAPPPGAGTESSTPAIHLHNISKQYGRIAAVRDVSLDVLPGEIFGFLGLNGAGKTTTIRIILDLVRPTSGHAEVFGRRCEQEGLAARAAIGYLPGELGFYGDMTGEATLTVLARLNGRAVSAERQQQLLDRMQLSSRDMRRRIREYSTGMKRKLGIVQAFQGDPPLLILDEPTEGLDPLMQDAFYELLDETKGRGRTVFMSSHVLSEVERVCDRIGLIKHGELVLTSTVSHVRSMADRTVKVIHRRDPAIARPVVSQPLPAGCTLVDVTGRTSTFRVRGALGPLLTRVMHEGVDDIEVSEPHLEDVLKAYYKDEPRS